jgi:6-phosphogluconolactonase
MRAQYALDVFPDAEAMAQHGAAWLVELAHAKQGVFAVCLSGGNTPRRLYELLAEPPCRERFPWPQTHWFWGDERFVPHDDKRSNYRMAREALLSRAPIPAENVHPIPTEGLDPGAAATAYEDSLKLFYGAQQFDPARPLFDVNLLGLGEDGHTASLFPGDTALTEDKKWVCAVTGAKPEPRITLTYPALESSRQVAFLVAGNKKRAILQRLRAGDQSLPAARVRPAGTLRIFADAAAGGKDAEG